MAYWPPKSSVPEMLTDPDELRRGDLVFGRKFEGPLALLGKAAGEPWRHVGVVSERMTDAGLETVVVEVQGNAFIHRPLGEFLSFYDEAGAARLDRSPDCVRQATDWMDASVNDDHHYAWDDLILAGIIAATKRGLLGRYSERVWSAIEAAHRACKAVPEHKGKRSLTCSAFIHMAYDELDEECRLTYHTWLTAPGVGWPPRVRSMDSLFGPDGSARAVAGDAALVDLLDGLHLVDRSYGDIHIEIDQVLEVLQVLFRAVAGVADANPTAAMIRGDGRWITPGDLWTSTALLVRGHLRY